jgi:hypothetical protein
VVTKVEKITNEDMEIMMDFIKKHFQERIYRKPKNIDEFIEDICYYFLHDQTKKYTQAWEKRIYKTLKLDDPEGSWVEWKTNDRINDLEEAGIDLEIYKEGTEKEIRKMKKREIEHHIRKLTKNAKSIDAMIFRDNYFKQLQEKGKGKISPDLENALT